MKETDLAGGQESNATSLETSQSVKESGSETQHEIPPMFKVDNHSIEPIGMFSRSAAPGLRGVSAIALARPIGALALSDSLTKITRPLASSLLTGSLINMALPLGGGLLTDSIAKIVSSPFADLGRNIFVPSYPSHIEFPNIIQRTAVSINYPGRQQASDLEKVDDPALAIETKYWLTQFDALVKDVGLRQICRSLFADGYYDLAVQRACTYLHNVVREKSGRYDKDGADLMMAVFSPKAPTLVLNQLITPSEKNEQQGYMFILAGTMTGIRNPRSHEHDFVDTPEEAFEILVLVNHLMRRLNNSALA